MAQEAAEPRYVIRLVSPIDPEDGTLYWSDEDGWGFLSTATVYADATGALPLDECEYVALP